MERVAGAWCNGDTVCFRLADQRRRYTGVRLRCGILGDPALSYDEADRTWVLRAPRPAAARLEYKFELTHRDGRAETVCDPGNPTRAPRGYGDSSVLWCPDYREPDWLHLPPADGSWRDLTVPV